MSLTIGVPGAPALHPTYIATAAKGGAYDVPAASVTDTNKFTPSKNFSYATRTGNIKFYKGMARVVPPGMKTELVAAGLGS